VEKQTPHAMIHLKIARHSSKVASSRSFRGVKGDIVLASFLTPNALARTAPCDGDSYSK
jgi:hypothetical protein